MMPLAEKYRPRTLDEVVGQPKAVATLRRFIAGGAGGRAYFLSGASGTGKTTLARIIAESVADPFYVAEYVGRQLTMRTLDDIEQSSRLYALGKGGRAIIVNECHGLPKPVIERLLDMLEPGNIPAHVAWVFTTTKAGQQALFDDQIDAHPLLSRCIVIPLTNQGLCAAFAAHVKAIAEREGLDGRDVKEYERLAKREGNNCRAMLQAIEAGEMLASA